MEISKSYKKEEQQINPHSFEFLLPSFFHLISSLISSNINFSLIFRSFGKDFHVVGREWGLFASGEHGWWDCPRFNGDQPINSSQTTSTNRHQLGEQVLPQLSLMRPNNDELFIAKWKKVLCEDSGSFKSHFSFLPNDPISSHSNIHSFLSSLPPHQVLPTILPPS